MNTTTSADGTTIGYHKIGTGPSLVVVHGSLRSGEDYQDLAHHLASSFTVYLVDRRGRSDSGPQGQDYSIEKEAQDVVAVLQESQAVFLFGHSFGGAVSLEVTAQGYPLKKLALYEPALSIDRSIDTHSAPHITAALAAHDYEQAFMQTMKIVSGGGIPEAQLPQIARSVMQSPLWPHMQALLPTIPAELKAVEEAGSHYQKYHSILTETLLMHGAVSPAYALKSVKQLSEIIPHNTVVELPGIGHNGPDTDAPDQVARLLVEFFS